MDISTIFDDTPSRGHNSGATFDGIRHRLQGEVAEAQAYYVKHEVGDKAAADRCENWRLRIVEFGREAETARKAEKAPHIAAGSAVDAKWRPLMELADDASRRLKTLTDAWIRAEEASRRREAQALADAARAADLAAAEARSRELPRDSPDVLVPSPGPPPSVVLAERVMVGTVRQRSATAPARLATIVDLKAAALWLAEQEHPDLIIVIQKCADRAAKARSSMPGIHIE